MSGSGDGFVRTWDVATGERLGLFRGHRSKVLSVRWHPRGPWIASSDEGGTIRYWEADGGQPLDTLRGHDGHVYALRFSSLGDRLLSSSWDTTVRVWDGQPGANDTSVSGVAITSTGPYVLAFSADAEGIVWTRGASELGITDVRTGEDLAALWPGGELSLAVTGLACDPARDVVHTIGSSGTLRRWDARTAALLSSTRTGIGNYAAAFDARCERVATLGAEEGRVHVLDTETGAPLWNDAMSGAYVADFGPRGELLVLGSRHLGLAVRRAETGEVVWEQPHPGHVLGLGVDPGGEWIATHSYNEWDNALHFWSLETGALRATHVGHAQPIDLDVAPDGTRVVTGNWDGTLSLWSPERGEVFTLQGHGTVVPRVGFSPDGATIASLGQGGRARLWNATPVESRGAARRAAARRRLYREDARRRVDELWAERLHVRAVVDVLEADPSLEPEQREAAILAARARGDEPAALAAGVVSVAADGARSTAAYLHALDAARLGLELYPDHWLAHDVLAAAQVRMGLDREAVASFGRATELRRAAGVPERIPAVFHALRALAHHRLGEAGAARTQLRIAREQLKRTPEELEAETGLPRGEQTLAEAEAALRGE